ncbi:MAG TPA: DinB family protein [Candidatus Acidoferrales bacterium]|nr:DinB family protein [Candidatus Acidoferrales bacterium]
MKKLFLAVLAAGLAMGIGAARTSANPPQSSQSTAQEKDTTTPSYDMKAQSIEDLQDLQKKFTALAGAIPAEKYSWRPGEGVRSIGEVYLHIAAANHNIPTMIGAAKSPQFMTKGFEQSVTDKQQIITVLNESFDYAISVVKGMSNADFAKAQKQLGPDANSGDVVYLLVTHAHEHLGQSIAYARMNGVVPPWTAAAQAKAKAADKD